MLVWDCDGDLLGDRGEGCLLLGFGFGFGRDSVISSSRVGRGMVRTRYVGSGLDGFSYLRSPWDCDPESIDREREGEDERFLSSI